MSLLAVSISVNSILYAVLIVGGVGLFIGIALGIAGKFLSVEVDEKEVAVTLKEFQLLCYLLLNKGIVLSREQIMQAVWDIPFEMESRTIDMHIMSLRQKLGGEGAAIRTIRGVGYRLGEREK